jgi:hypothetical protein
MLLNLGMMGKILRMLKGFYFKFFFNFFNFLSINSKKRMLSNTNEHFSDTNEHINNIDDHEKTDSQNY